MLNRQIFNEETISIKSLITMVVWYIIFSMSLSHFNVFSTKFQWMLKQN